MGGNEPAKPVVGRKRQMTGHSGAATALSKRRDALKVETLGRKDALGKRCRAALATAVQMARGVLECAGRAERRRRFRSGETL